MRLSALARGSVVLVAIPFTDLTATKVRPAVVLCPPDARARHADVIIAALSSLPRGDGTDPTDVLVATEDPDFRDSGLRVASVVHCRKIATLEGTLVLKWIGRLGPRTMRRIDVALRAALGLR